MTVRQVKRYARAVLALTMGAGSFAALATPAAASHETTTIRVGIANDGSNGRNNYDDSDLARMTGTTFSFFFEDGDHNVRWTTANPGALAASPGGTAVIGSTFTVTPNVAGTYIYYCSLHVGANEALTATDFALDRPAGMYGRLVITGDTTAPVWGAGTATATANSASQITLTWPSATDNSGTVFYDVFQSTTATPQPATPVSDNQSGLTYVATGLTSGVTYYYWVVPVDAANNAAVVKTATAATSSVAASAAASAVVAFATNPTLSITVTPALLDLGTLSPAAAGTGSATVTVGSNDVWSLSVKSIGRDGVDDAAGDDAVFRDNGVKTIPVSRATWNDGSGALPLSDVSAVAVTAQPAAAATIVTVAFSMTPLFTDPTGADYRTTVLYTATQP